MPYESDIDNFTESVIYDNNNIGFDNSGDLSLRGSLLLSGDQQSGESSVSSETGEDSEYNTDYSDILGSIDSTTTLSLEQIESLSVQVDNLNNNICILNENIRLGVGFSFCILIILCVRVVFSLFNKVLGLGQA